MTSDDGPGDASPALREKVLAADSVVFGTPIWMGQLDSVSKRALELMDAFLEETDDQGRMVSYGKVAAITVVGNEDGAHHVSAEMYQALNDVGFTISAFGIRNSGGLTRSMLGDGSDYTPYEGLEITGWPILPMVRGNVVVREGKLLAEKGVGTYLPLEISSPLDFLSELGGTTAR